MDEQLRAFVMKILKGMIEEGKASSDIRRYAFARLKDNSINFEDVEEIDRLLEERDKPVETLVEETPIEQEDSAEIVDENSEIISAEISEDNSELSSDESEVEE